MSVKEESTPEGNHFSIFFRNFRNSIEQSGSSVSSSAIGIPGCDLSRRQRPNLYKIKDIHAAGFVCRVTRLLGRNGKVAAQARPSHTPRHRSPSLTHAL